MTRFEDALSSFKKRFSDYFDGFVDWVEPKKKKYWAKQRFDRFYWYVKDNLETYGKSYLKYGLYELAPNIVAYGLLFNIPGAFFFGFPITWFSVLSFGCGWYIVFEESPAVIQRTIPNIRVKVDN